MGLFDHSPFSKKKSREHASAPTASTLLTTTPKKLKRASSSAALERHPVEVCLRVRPLTFGESTDGSSCIDHTDDDPNAILFKIEELEREKKQARFVFSKIFPGDSTQHRVFEDTTLPLVTDLLLGRNALLFTYGITNSGKTHTMEGPDANPGIIKRLLAVVFNSIKEYRADPCLFRINHHNGVDVLKDEEAAERRAVSGFTPDGDRVLDEELRMYDDTVIEVDPDCRYSVFVSFVEIYNEQVYDLLEPSEKKGWTNSASVKRVTPKQLSGPDEHGRMFVRDATEVEVRSIQDALLVLAKGHVNRQVASTILNHTSSRSHAVFNIKLVRAPLDARGEKVLRDKKYPPHISQFSLVDLAGSERTARTHNTGERLKETGSINKSLMVLCHCMEELRKNQESGKTDLVHYRRSNLTKLFKNYFDGDGKVLMIVCISPSLRDAEETYNVLKFSALTQEVTTKPSSVGEKPQFSAGRGKQRPLDLSSSSLFPSAATTPATDKKGSNRPMVDLDRDDEQYIEDEQVQEYTDAVHSLEDRLHRDLEQYAQAVQARYLRQKDLLYNAVYHRNDAETMKAQLDLVSHENERLHVQVERTQHDVLAWKERFHEQAAVVEEQSLQITLKSEEAVSWQARAAQSESEKEQLRSELNEERKRRARLEEMLETLKEVLRERNTGPSAVPAFATPLRDQNSRGVRFAKVLEHTRILKEDSF